jgi:hypothetical protein
VIAPALLCLTLSAAWLPGKLEDFDAAGINIFDLPIAVYAS